MSNTRERAGLGAECAADFAVEQDRIVGEGSWPLVVSFNFGIEVIKCHMHHRLSTAAQAFKRHALRSVREPVPIFDPTETFRVKTISVV